MVTVSAHFDGKVIVPDEPLDLPPNQALIVQIERVGGEAVNPDESALTWLADNAVDSEALPTDLADWHDHYLYGHSSADVEQASRPVLLRSDGTDDIVRSLAPIGDADRKPDSK